MWVVLRPIPTKREGYAHGSLFERKFLVKSPELKNRAQRKVDYINYYVITMRRNYFRKLSPKIITENYEWKLSVKIYKSRRRCEIYRDTGVSKKYFYYRKTFLTTFKQRFLVYKIFMYIYVAFTFSIFTTFYLKKTWRLVHHLNLSQFLIALQ